MNKLEKVFTKFANKKIFILSKNHSITYQEMYLRALAFAENLQNKHKSLSGKIIFLNMERSHNYFIAILGLIFLGATIIPISDKINNLELNYLRKKYKPFLEIENFNVRKTKKKVRVPQNFLLKSKIIFFTSGTTGKPRGILHNISNLLLSAESFSTLANYKVGKKILHNWPHYYMAGFFNMFLCSLVKGCTIVLDDEIGKNNYLKYWSTLKKSKIDFAYLSPTMAQALIAYSTYEKNIRKNSITTSIISTGSFLYRSTFLKFKDIFGINLIKCYGITEVGGSITLEKRKNITNNSVGKISSGIKIKISKDREILVKANFMFEGYLENSRDFKKFSSDYFATGDLGEFKNGLLYINGRNKEIIKKGGEQVSLIRIEDTALGFDDVKDVIARGVPSEFWGETVELDVVFLPDNKKINQINRIEILKKYLQQNLSQLEMPAKIYSVESIPKTLIGKNYRQVFQLL